MKTDITIGSYHAVFEHPKDAYLVGVTVKHSGMDFSTIDGLSIEGDCGYDETVELECGVILVFHYYTHPILKALADSFADFPGMKVVEIREKAMCLFQTME